MAKKNKKSANKKNNNTEDIKKEVPKQTSKEEMEKTRQIDVTEEKQLTAKGQKVGIALLILSFFSILPSKDDGNGKAGKIVIGLLLIAVIIGGVAYISRNGVTSPYAKDPVLKIGDTQQNSDDDNNQGNEENNISEEDSISNNDTQSSDDNEVSEDDYVSNEDGATGNTGNEDDVESYESDTEELLLEAIPDENLVTE